MAGRKKIDVQEWLTPENKLRIQGWCRDGLIEKQIYKNMGVSKNVFYRWKNESQEFKELLKESKDTADREVENALFKSATGFVGPDEKYYPPNTTAQIFWLKNRKHEDWRDKRETDVNVSTPVSETALKVEAILKGEEQTAMKSNVEEILLVPESTINFIVKENESLRERIEKALSYIEDNDLYNVDWDYSYEEELEYRGADDATAREDLIAILKGEEVQT